MYNVKPALYIRKAFVSTQHFGAVVDGVGLTMCGKSFFDREAVVDTESARKGRDECRSCRRAWDKATSYSEHAPGHPSMSLPVARQWYRKIEVVAL